MKSRSAILLVFGVAFIVGTACLRDDAFPPQPNITEAVLIPNPDSTAVMRISFTDGDGDIGLNEGDTLAPFNPGSEFFSNLIFNYFEFSNGKWQRVYLGIDPVTGDTTNPFSYRIPVLETDGRDKALEGDIDVDMPFGYFNPFTEADSLRYEVVLYDRALNEARATTQTLLKP